jgi:phosphate transport system permease protein
MSLSAPEQNQQVEETPLKPQAPWKSVNRKTLVSALFSVLVPLSLLALGFAFTSLPGPVLVVILFGPAQLISAMYFMSFAWGKRAYGDAAISVLTVSAFGLVLALLGSVVFSVVFRGLPMLRISFITQNNTYISPTTDLSYGGVGHAIIGTFMVVAIATLIAVPFGIASAIYINEVQGRLAGLVRFFIQAMSGVPSIVAGLFIFAALVLSDVLGLTAFAGGLAYAVLMLPTVARTTEEVLKLVPKELRNAAIALGSSRARVVLRIVIPTAKTGIITAVILGIARIIGETAPLIYTAGYANNTNLNPFKDAVATLPVYLFQFLGTGYETAVRRSWGAALVLFIMVAILFTVIRIFSSRKGKK